MNAFMSFLPFLALVAFMSVEVTAEVTEITKHEQLYEFQNGFKSMSIKYTGGKNITLLPVASATVGCDGTLEGCGLPIGSYDEETMVSIAAMVPAATALPVANDTGVPSKIIFRQCFSPQSAAGRKWRKLNQPFKKDNSCKTGSIIDGITVEYPVDGGMVSESYKLGEKTPTGQMTVRAYVQCDKQEGKQYCHMINYQNATGADVFFPTEVMENRPASLFTAVLICAFIGPILLAAFLIYERGILAKQA